MFVCHFIPAQLLRLSALLVVLGGLCRADPPAAAELNFDRDVAPIFVAHCLDCHGASEPKGGLNLQLGERAATGGESGQAIVAGDAQQSLLWRRLRDDEMPPKRPLSDKRKAIIKQWINEGAKWGTSPIDPLAATTSARAGRDWWSLQPLRDITLPAAAIQSSGNEVDALLDKKRSSAGLSRSTVADPRTLIRRLSFDLIGLPPSPEQVASFVGNPSDEAYRRMVDELLASKHYGERWARHWLDVVRFGESDGFERNAPRKNAWPYRDWIIKAFNDDLPYDEFARQQLFGDQLTGGPSGAAATGFWVAGVHNVTVGGSDRMKQLARQDEIEDVLATVGQTFLGLTVNCARCHDHKFDPITQREFYQLASAISGLGFGERIEQSTKETKRLESLDRQLAVLASELQDMNSTARDRILAARGDSSVETTGAPQPIALWEFDVDLRDSFGNLHGTAVGPTQLVDGALVVDGKSFVQTGPIGRDIAEKTLEVWVQVDDPHQRGGGVITMETTNGVLFDSIVYGEQKPKHWLAGSNNFARTDSFQAPEETAAVDRAVHVAIVYHVDGTIIGYRDGLRYGQPVRKSALQKYKANETDFVFGLRHKPAGGNRQLKGRIHRAACYDRALTDDEVAASAASRPGYVSEKQIVASLSAEQNQHREKLRSQVLEARKARDTVATQANRKFYTLTARPAVTTRVLLRGDPDKPGDVVPPGAVAAVNGVTADFSLAPNAPEPERRRRLMQWISSPANPLFARVIVNRIWHYHFGTGIVDSPNDFGFNGGRPSHPDLLEWLSVRFRDGGFRLKPLHRLLVTSHAYRQAGYPGGPDSMRAQTAKATAPDSAEGRAQTSEIEPSSIDANNRLLWRMTPRRLEAEAIRDAMLVVSGQLNSEMGGPGFEDVSIVSNNGTTYYEPLDVDDARFFRRTVYRFGPRGQRSALLDTFDCPDPASAAPRRSVTTTPLQALSLLNNSFVLRMSKYFAERVERDAGPDVTHQIRRAWQLAIGRDPLDNEQSLSLDLVEKHGLPALCRALFNTNEFVVVE